MQAILINFSLGGMLNYNLVPMHISPTIHYKAGHSYKINIIQELMNLLHRNKFSPWEDFFVNPFGSDVISPNQLCKCTYIYVYQYRCWSKHMQWNNEEVLFQGSIFVSLTLYF